MRSWVRISSILFASLTGIAAAFALRVPDDSRFRSIVLYYPSAQAGIVAESHESIPGFESEAQGWSQFKAAHGGGWEIHVDRRSGAPLLVQGQGTRWFDPESPAPSLEALAAKALAFVTGNSQLFRVDPSQLVFNAKASGVIDDDHRVLAFDRAIDGSNLPILRRSAPVKAPLS